jgi:esterase/lipase superfamily enzyme
MGKLETPSLYRFRVQDDPQSDVTVVAGKFFFYVLGAIDRCHSDQIQLSSSSQNKERARGLEPIRQALVFIHGYNTRFEEAIQRTAQACL